MNRPWVCVGVGGGRLEGSLQKTRSASSPTPPSHCQNKEGRNLIKI
uniref:Uncharacterized protein n=1 Tax=Anguilla anguilla TaxID=7936 RepID=A0A0E9WGZ3_ANGAN